MITLQHIDCERGGVRRWPRACGVVPAERAAMEEPASHESPISRLIETLRSQGIADESVLAAIARVPRHRFVPDSQQSHAWENVALPIGAGQTISQPYIVAIMSQALELEGNERVLEIGTGSGYQAAVLATLARHVVTIERHAVLARAAESLLGGLGFTNIDVHIGDGTQGWQEAAPYDGILITAGAPNIPKPLLSQLSPDRGRLIIPIGSLDDQRLVGYERRGEQLAEHDLGPVRFVPLVGRGAWGATSENGHQL
jgi:protein-L-isoaspartate(D-aspartate) O-methyltransferase